MRFLIVNADDLGYDPAIDRGILEAHARGIVTSATAMVRTPFSAAALRGAPASLGVGLHAVLDPAMKPADVERALVEQLARFEELRGRAPTHLDSHKHVHATPGILEPFLAIARERGLPVRAIDPPMAARVRSAGLRAPDVFLGDASLRPAWTPERLEAAVCAIGDGVTELMAHPGYRPTHARTSFAIEREAELEALCAAGVRRVVERFDVRLVDFSVLR